MDGHEFDDVFRSLARSRRSLFTGALAMAAGWLSLPDVAARNRRKRKSRKARPNVFGCLNVGVTCKNAGQCCSGVCEGKKGKRKCQAHDSGTCSAGGQIAECGGTTVACTTSLGKPGRCGTTTGNAGYCFTFGACSTCKTDVECQTEAGGILGPRAACVRCETCAGTGTVCVTHG
jgi:hypothetical protein